MPGDSKKKAIPETPTAQQETASSKETAAAKRSLKRLLSVIRLKPKQDKQSIHPIKASTQTQKTSTYTVPEAERIEKKRNKKNPHTAIKIKHDKETRTYYLLNTLNNETERKAILDLNPMIKGEGTTSGSGIHVTIGQGFAGKIRFAKSNFPNKKKDQYFVVKKTSDDPEAYLLKEDEWQFRYFVDKAYKFIFDTKDEENIQKFLSAWNLVNKQYKNLQIQEVQEAFYKYVKPIIGNDEVMNNLIKQSEADAKQKINPDELKEKLAIAKRECYYNQTILQTKHKEKLKDLYVAIHDSGETIKDKIWKDSNGNQYIGMKKKTVYQFMDYYPLGDGKSYAESIHNNKALTQDEKNRLIGKMVKSALEIMAKFHENKLYHGDLKAENFLVANKEGKEGDLRLADFGSAVWIEDGIIKRVSDQSDTKYFPPDYYQKDTDLNHNPQHVEKADTYSLGLALLEFYGIDLSAYFDSVRKSRDGKFNYGPITDAIITKYTAHSFPMFIANNVLMTSRDERPSVKAIYDEYLKNYYQFDVDANPEPSNPPPSKSKHKVKFKLFTTQHDEGTKSSEVPKHPASLYGEGTTIYSKPQNPDNQPIPPFAGPEQANAPHQQKKQNQTDPNQLQAVHASGEAYAEATKTSPSQGEDQTFVPPTEDYDTMPSTINKEVNTSQSQAQPAMPSHPSVVTPPELFVGSYSNIHTVIGQSSPDAFEQMNQGEYGTLTDPHPGKPFVDVTAKPPTEDKKEMADMKNDEAKQVVDMPKEENKEMADATPPKTVAALLQEMKNLCEEMREDCQNMITLLDQLDEMAKTSKALPEASTLKTETPSTPTVVDPLLTEKQTEATKKSMFTSLSQFFGSKKSKSSSSAPAVNADKNDQKPTANK